MHVGHAHMGGGGNPMSKSCCVMRCTANKLKKQELCFYIALFFVIQSQRWIVFAPGVSMVFRSLSRLLNNVVLVLTESECRWQ